MQSDNEIILMWITTMCDIYFNSNWLENSEVAALTVKKENKSQLYILSLNCRKKILSETMWYILVDR